MARSLAVGAWLGTYYRGLVSYTRTAVLYTSAFSGALLIPLVTSHRMVCAAGG